jgi:O-antigen ligase
MESNWLTSTVQRTSVLLTDRIIFVILVLAIIQKSHPKYSYLAYVVALCGVLLEYRAAAELFRRSFPLVLLMCFATASYFWSYSPSDTALAMVGLYGTVAITVYGICRLGMRGFLQGLAIAISVSALLSIAFIVLLPAEGIQGDGGIRGFYSYKTELGLGMVIGLISNALAARESHGNLRAVFVGGFVLCLGILSRANSITGVLTFAIFLVILTVLLRARAKRSARLAFIGIIALSSLMPISQSDYAGQVFSVVGRDATLTGRTDIWNGVLTAISQRPTLGYGYGAFWLDNGPSEEYVDADTWGAHAAHNGYLETLLNVGILGLCVLAYFIIAGIWRSSRFFWRGGDWFSAWPLCILLNALITNYAEATFMYARVDWLAIMAAFLLASVPSPPEINRDTVDTGIELSAVSPFIPSVRW